MTINSNQFRQYVIRASLQPIGLWSPEAEELLIGTAAHESQLGTYLAQVGGPALGVFQMEPATWKDLHKTFLYYQKDLYMRINGVVRLDHRQPGDMITDLEYACVMARLRYYRVPDPLPAKDDLQAQARYWKQFYNTPMGKGTVEQYIDDYHKYVTHSNP